MFKFDPKHPSRIKTEAWEFLRTVPEALVFLNWCCILKITSKDEGVMSFDPNNWFDAQWKVIMVIFSCLKDNIRTLWILKGRQEGITTIITAFDLFYAFKHNKLQACFIAADYKISAEIRNIIREFYSSLPLKTRYLKSKDNATELSFSNGSRIKMMYTTARKSKQGSMGRSSATNYGHGTEVAYFQSEDDYNSMVATLSETHPDRFYIWESTANGYGFFYDCWETAKSSDTQRTLFLGWWLKNTYVLEDERDIKKYCYEPNSWEQEQIEMVNKLYGYSISIEQLGWWRKKMVEDIKPRGMLSQEDTALQEFPFTEFDSFRLSGKSLFHYKMIENIRSANGLGFTPLRSLEPIFMTKPEETELKEHPSGKIKIWEEYDPSVKYVLAADPTYGANPDSDNGCIAIYAMYKDKIIQVLEYADNLVDQYHYTWLLLSLAGMYNAHLILEVNGPGKTVLQFIDLYKRWILDNTDQIKKKNSIYEFAKKLRSEYVYKRPDSFNAGVARQWLTTAETKRHLMFQFQGAVNNNEVIIRSKSCLDEMEKIVIDKDSGYIGAESGYHDDRVITSAMAAEYWMQNFRTNLLTYEESKMSKQELLEKAETMKDPKTAFSVSYIQKIMGQTLNP